MAMSELVAGTVMAGCGSGLVAGSRALAADIEVRWLRNAVRVNVAVGGWILVAIAAVGALTTH